MTHLRKMMLEELERRNYAQTTTSLNVQAIEDFARYFKRPFDQLDPEHIREYQAYPFREKEARSTNRNPTAGRAAVLLHSDTEKTMEHSRDTVQFLRALVFHVGDRVPAGMEGEDQPILIVYESRIDFFLYVFRQAAELRTYIRSLHRIACLIFSFANDTVGFGFPDPAPR